MKKHVESERVGRFTVIKKILVYGALSCLAFLFVAYLVVCWSIRSSVKEMSAIATRQYPGDRIEALVRYVDSENHSLRERNRAVWALGQIGDERALPALEKLYTGEPCDHDNSLCQRELQRAITACKGAFNATAWLPRCICARPPHPAGLPGIDRGIRQHRRQAENIVRFRCFRRCYWMAGAIELVEQDGDESDN